MLALAEDRSRIWTMAVILMLANTLNHLDRQIINILAEPIKQEFGLADWQLGILTGLSFALLYGLASLPLAHIADRSNRPAVIAACLSVWSAATALCGAAQNYAQLVMGRLLVGLGEAGGSAPAQSLIADAVPRKRRATALAIFSLGIPLGGFLGMAFGGLILDFYGWRAALLLAGVPGLLLAPFILFMVREPNSGHPRPRPAERPSRSEMVASVKTILSIPTFRLITLSGTFITFVNYSQAAFIVSFMLRSHGDQVAPAAAAFPMVLGLSIGVSAFLGLSIGLARGASGIVGTLCGGFATDDLAARKVEYLTILPAIMTWLRIPLLMGVFLSPNFIMAMGFVAAQSLIVGIAAPAGYTTIQSVTRTGDRALAASIYMLALNLVGLGLGPVCVGAVSDILNAAGFGAANGLKWALVLTGVAGLCAAGALKWTARRTVAADYAG